MLVAYLRGLLKPTLPNALTSQVREELILQAVATDIGKELDMHETLMYAALANKPSKGLIGNLQMALEGIHEKAEHNREKTRKRDEERADLITLYKLLHKKGILDKLNKDKECKPLVIRH